MVNGTKISTLNIDHVIDGSEAKGAALGFETPLVSTCQLEQLNELSSPAPKMHQKCKKC